MKDEILFPSLNLEHVNTLCLLVPPPWADWWRAIAQNAELEYRFPARNLRLDENVEAWRAQSYASCLGSVRHPVWPTDSLPYAFPFHRKYIVDRLWKNHSGTLPHEIDPAEWNCPETFQRIPAGSPFLDANLDLKLLRVESVEGMAPRIGIDVKELIDVATSALQGVPSATGTLDLYLDTLADKSRIRPEFAAFHADVAAVFSEPDWVNRLRDTLGLIHYNPSGSEIPVLIFSYPIRDLPYLQGQPAFRPLVPPLVLESNWNAAFCPSPLGGRTGHTIDLSGTAPGPRREVLHPTMRYRARHLFRFGNIGRQVEKDTLEIARSLHLTEIRKMYGRLDYGSETDSDIV